MSEKKQPFIIDTASMTRVNTPFDAVESPPVGEPKDPVVDEPIEDITDDEIEDEVIEDVVDDDAEDPDDDQPDVNPYFYLSKQLQSDGFLGEDFEVGDEVDGLRVYNAYKDKLKSDIEPRVRQEVLNDLSQRGFNESDLLMARAIRQGVDPRLLSTAGAYEVYATMPDTSTENDKLAAVRAMYQDRGFNNTEIDRLVDSEDVDGLFSQSKTYFSGKYEKFVDDENKRAEAAEKASLEKYMRDQAIINGILSKKEILGSKIEPSNVKTFEESLFKETEVVELNGIKYKATPMQKFLIEFDNDPELKLYLFHNWLFKDVNKEVLKSEVKKELEKEFIKELDSKTVHSKASRNKKVVKEQLETNKNTQKSYFIDLNPKG